MAVVKGRTVPLSTGDKALDRYLEAQGDWHRAIDAMNKAREAVADRVHPAKRHLIFRGADGRLVFYAMAGAGRPSQGGSTANMPVKEWVELPVWKPELHKV